MFFKCVQFSWCFLLLLIEISADDKKAYKIVETENGSIRGIRMNTLLQKRDYFSFRGIRYAEPPVGELRFKAPRPIARSQPTIFDAFEYGSACIHQKTLLHKPLREDEDCLFLNIFVPEFDYIDPKEKLAVLFFIHGGGFVFGSVDDFYYGADFLIEKNVILVTINYRLGALGFLSIDSPEYSGNMGLKDQQLALKWIYANIGNFGGDYNRIMIFGHSAGAASTHFHMMSAESRKYFRNAIPMSGSAENFWAMSKENNHLAMVIDLAEKLGEPKETYDELVEFLKSISVDKIRKLFPSITFEHTLELIWTPVKEGSNAFQPFILDKLSGISSMFGFAAQEGLMLADKFNSFYSKDAEMKLVLPFRNVNLPHNSKEYRSIANKIYEFYVKGKSNKDLFKHYINLVTDLNFVYFIDKATKIQAAKSSADTFFYRFSIDSILNLIRLETNSSLSGSSHGDELCYLFRCALMQPVYQQILSNKTDVESRISLKAIENITKIFANFAKYGTPIHNGEPIEGVKPIQNTIITFIDITNDGLLIDVNPKMKAVEFWSHIEEEVRLWTNKSNLKEES